MEEVAKTFDEVNFDKVGGHARSLLAECPEFDDVIILVNWKEQYRQADLPVCIVESSLSKDENKRSLTLQTTQLCRLLRKVEETLVERELARLVNTLGAAFVKIKELAPEPKEESET